MVPLLFILVVISGRFRASLKTQVKLTSEYFIMTWAELLAEVGGYAGVLMGVSVINLAGGIRRAGEKIGDELERKVGSKDEENDEQDRVMRF